MTPEFIEATSPQVPSFTSNKAAKLVFSRSINTVLLYYLNLILILTYNLSCCGPVHGRYILLCVSNLFEIYRQWIFSSGQVAACHDHESVLAAAFNDTGVI